MNTTCKDLLDSNIFQACQLLTGDAGLDNLISFPFLTRCLTDENLFMDHEFVLVAEPTSEYTEQLLLDFLDICSNRKISGILLFLNSNSDFIITTSVIHSATEKKIPLFTSAWNPSSQDIVREISLHIQGSRLRHNALEMVLRNIFFFKNDEEEIQKLLNSDLHNSTYQIIRIQIFNFDHYCQIHNLHTEIDRYEQKIFIKRVLGSKLVSEFPNRPFCSHQDITALFHQSDEGTRSIVKRLKIVREYMSSIFPDLDLRFCVTGTFTELRDISNAYHQSFHLISLSNIEQFRKRIITYSNIGIYQLFLAVPKKILIANYNLIMHPLFEYDEENKSDLTLTLRTYLDANCSIESTSEQLYIHKNTIRYRLKKIEEVMDCDLKSSETITMLYYCFSIHNYVNA
jgi:hypothetical protein